MFVCGDKDGDGVQDKPPDNRTGLIYLRNGKEFKFIDLSHILCGTCPLCRGSGEI